tara:strand:+ start:817 stop:1248 length:432 start_codon:yes stop_codon:yes gene_type:complete
MNTNVVIGTLINEEPVSFDTYRQIIRHTPIIQDQNSTMNSTIPQGIPIIIPNLIMEVDEDDEMISEMICPEIFEGNIISGWSDSDGSEGMYINGIFDEDETDDDMFMINDPILRNCISRYFDYQSRVIREIQENTTYRTFNIE